VIVYYGYEKCSTCRKVKAWLKSRGIDIEERDITTEPPPVSALRAILKSGKYRLADLFNRSGELYRAMNMKEKLKKLSDEEALALLAKHGRLVKRPIITDGKRHTVGFDEQRLQIWQE